VGGDVVQVARQPQPLLVGQPQRQLLTGPLRLDGTALDLGEVVPPAAGHLADRQRQQHQQHRGGDLAGRAGVRHHERPAEQARDQRDGGDQGERAAADGGGAVERDQRRRPDGPGRVVAGDRRRGGRDGHRDGEQRAPAPQRQHQGRDGEKPPAAPVERPLVAALLDGLDGAEDREGSEQDDQCRVSCPWPSRPRRAQPGARAPRSVARGSGQD
jgi:hypothetical protein